MMIDWHITMSLRSAFCDSCIVIFIAILFLYICRYLVFLKKASLVWWLLLFKICVPVHFFYLSTTSLDEAVVHQVIISGKFVAEEAVAVTSYFFWDKYIWFYMWGIVTAMLFVRKIFLYVCAMSRLQKMPKVENPAIIQVLELRKKQLGIGRSIRCVFGENCFTTGLFFPVIVLPKTIIKNWDLKEIEFLLLHELIHIKRFDYITVCIQQILQTIYFFHPLVWFLNFQIQETRELKCDHKVVAITGKVSCYIRTLLKFAEQQKSPLRLSLSFFPLKSSLHRRSYYMLRSSNCSCKTIFYLVLVLIISVIVVPLQGQETQLNNFDISAIVTHFSKSKKKEQKLSQLKNLILHIDGVRDVQFVEGKSPIIQVDCLDASISTIKKLTSEFVNFSRQKFSVSVLLMQNSEKHSEIKITTSKLEFSRPRGNVVSFSRVILLPGMKARIETGEEIYYIKDYDIEVNGNGSPLLGKPVKDNCTEFECFIFRNSELGKNYIDFSITLQKLKLLREHTTSLSREDDKVVYFQVPEINRKEIIHSSLSLDTMKNTRIKIPSFEFENKNYNAVIFIQKQ